MSSRALGFVEPVLLQVWKQWAGGEQLEIRLCLVWYHGGQRGLKGSFEEELGGLEGGARAGPPSLWELFNTGGGGMETVPKSTAASGISARMGFLCRQEALTGPHSEGHPHKPTRELQRDCVLGQLLNFLPRRGKGKRLGSVHCFRLN